MVFSPAIDGLWLLLGILRTQIPIIVTVDPNLGTLRVNMDKSMLNSSTRLLFFQFSSMDGLDPMLENGLVVFRNNPFILKRWNPDVNLLKEDVGNVSVWVKFNDVPVIAFSEDSLSAIATKLGTPLMLDSYASDMCMQSWGRLRYARAMIKLQADVELKDNIVVVMPKLIGEGSIHVLFALSSCVAKNLKNPSQAPRGVSVGPMVGFKPVRLVYRPISKKNNVNTSNKKKDVESRKEVSNLNPFDVLNSVENDVDLVIDEEITLVDDEGKPMKKVDYSGDHDSEDEVEPVDNEMVSFRASKRVDYGTNSLLEQWRKTYENVNYDCDPYDDNMYKGQEFPDNIQSIYDNLDIKETGGTFS
nr:hypothetical protein [Tanacetum cinerariifolium]